jgi:hypothetical protein
VDDAPTDVTEQNDPGFQFRLKEGAQAIQRSAAAKGTLLTGGTMKDLNSWAQGQASNEYGKVYDRAFNEYTTANQIFNQNQNNQFGRLNTLSSQGLSAAGQYGANASGYGANSAANTTGAANAEASGVVGASNASTSGWNTATNTVLEAALAEWKRRNPTITTTSTIPGTPVARDPNLPGNG